MNFRQKHLNHQLKKIGFGGIDDPQLIHQMAFCVRDHEHFRKVLLAVETGEQRRIAYDAMRPHLNFEAKPLDWYIMKGKEEAEELQLPVKNQDGSFTPYKDYHGEKPSLEVMAEKAIAETAFDKALTLTCAKCTRVQKFPAADRLTAFSAAQKAGWVFTLRPPKEIKLVSPSGSTKQIDIAGTREEIAICPKCPAVRVQVAGRFAHA